MVVTMFKSVPFVLALVITWVWALSFEEALNMARDQLQVETLDRFAADPSLRTPSYRRKKTTPSSMEMDQRNRLVKRAAELIDPDQSANFFQSQSVLDLLSRAVGGPTVVGRVQGFENHQALILAENLVCSPSVSIQCNASDPNPRIDGVCNNLQNPLWGSVDVQLTRYLPAQYSDGVGKPYPGDVQTPQRKSTNVPCTPIISSCPSTTKMRLPNPRMVSTSFHQHVNIPDAQVTHMMTQMGQFLDHDVTLTPEIDIHDCCQNPNQDGCNPILMPDSEIVLTKKCLEFSRSTSFCEGTKPKREQMNCITSFVDASNVYGSDYNTARSLRSFEGGKLKSDIIGGKYEMLPKINGTELAGDIRALEMPGLAAIHTLFVREHNRIAQELSGLNDDEVIYHKARRLVMAQMQHIVYHEYLPILLGDCNIMDDSLDSQGYSTYDPNVDPSMSNSFATAAFRIGHTMIEGLINLIHETTGAVDDTFKLRNNFFVLDKYFKDNGAGMQRLINGLINQPAQASDRFVVEEVTNFLFRGTNETFGSDLIARNIHRGRDHGLPGYNDWREFCGLPRICSWKRYPESISAANWDILATLYDHPNDIDLFTAGIAENLVPGTLTGPIFNCILTKQFQAVRRGDRFFYTHKDQVGSLTPVQLAEISRRTLADIICDNTEILQTKSNVFLLSSPFRPCSNRNTLNVTLFL